MREIHEELGLEACDERLAAEVTFNENPQVFFLCGVVSGVFGTGDGEEYRPDLSASRGTYESVWMGKDALLDHNVRPRLVWELIMNGYPAFVSRHCDPGTRVTKP